MALSLPTYVPRKILGAGTFHHAAQGAPVGYGDRPGRRENAGILDGERKLESLAAIVGVERRTGIATAADVEIFLQASGLPRSRGGVVDQPVPLDDVHRRALRRAEVVHHGQRADPDPDGIDHQGVGFEMADRISRTRSASPEQDAAGSCARAAPRGRSRRAALSGPAAAAARPSCRERWPARLRASTDCARSHWACRAARSHRAASLPALPRA